MEWLETLLEHLPWILSGVGVFILGLIVAWIKWSGKKFVDDRVQHSLDNGGGKKIRAEVEKANKEQTKEIQKWFEIILKEVVKKKK